MATWLVELKGERADLEDFPEWFPDGEPRVLREGDTYYLTGSAFECIDQASEAHDLAIGLIDELFAIGSLMWPSLRKPSIGSLVREDESGRKNYHVMQTEGIEARSKVSAALVSVDGQSPQPVLPTSAQVLLSKSRSDRHLQACIVVG